MERTGLFLTLVLMVVLEVARAGTIQEAEEDPRVTYEILKEAPFCRAFLRKEYQGAIDFVGRYQDTNETFIDSKTLGMEVRKEMDEIGDTIGFPMDLDYLIPGLRIGMTGQCRHETRRIWVPKELVTGGKRAFSEEYIPRGRDLIFDVVLWNAMPNYMVGMPNMFKVYDSDEDGFISKKEVGEYLTDQEKFPSGPVITKLINEFIKKDDRNGDQKISWDEFSGPKFDWDEEKKHDEL